MAAVRVAGVSFMDSDVYTKTSIIRQQYRSMTTKDRAAPILCVANVTQPGLALKTGISRDALWFHEKRGPIRAVRGANGYRRYAQETVPLVGYIRLAQGLGFSLAEAGAHLRALWDAPEPEAANELALRAGLVAQRDTPCPIAPGACPA